MITIVRKLNLQETIRHSQCPKSLGNTPTPGQEMAQFTEANITGTLFETTERSEQLPPLHLNQMPNLSCRYQHLEPVGMGISGLVWYGVSQLRKRPNQPPNSRCKETLGAIQDRVYCQTHVS